MQPGSKNNATASRGQSPKRIPIMAERPMRKLISALAAPTIVAQLITKTYNLADAFLSVLWVPMLQRRWESMAPWGN